MLGIIALAMATAAAPAATPAPAAEQPMTLQQKFNAASNAAMNNDCPTAISIFDDLQQGNQVPPDTLPAAMIAVRKGICQVDTGQQQEGVASIQSGLSTIEAAGPNFTGDVYNAQMALGEVAQGNYDYLGARHHFEAALQLVHGLNRALPLVQLAKATSFDGTSAPIDYAEQGLALVRSQPDSNAAKRKLMASFLIVEARALLNQGNARDAYDKLKQALDLSGGLTARISQFDVDLRSDLAQAAMLLGKTDDVHLYLAYTGAGHLEDARFVPAQFMTLPVCGSETGLRPDDTAVVKFSIAPDGSVQGAQTVYTRGGPQVAAIFAREVRQWYWDPASIAKIPAFYRTDSRVELRCTLAGSDAPAITTPLFDRFDAWAKAQVPVQFDIGKPVDSVAVLRPLLAAPDIRSHPARYVAAAGLLSQLNYRLGITPNGQTSAALLTDFARQARLPAEVVNTLRVLQAQAASPYNSKQAPPRGEWQAYVHSLFDLAQTPELSQDAIAADTLRLLGAQLARWLPDPASVASQLQLVATDARLADHSPLRQAAYLQLANLAAQAHDLDKAQDYFHRTGLTEEQCALLGVKPSLVRADPRRMNFPTDAVRYGFSGWTRLEFDVKADGKADNGRTTVAYPPFVFSANAAQNIRQLVYTRSYRPDDKTTCSAESQIIGFRLN